MAHKLAPETLRGYVEHAKSCGRGGESGKTVGFDAACNVHAYCAEQAVQCASVLGWDCSDDRLEESLRRKALDSLSFFISVTGRVAELEGGKFFVLPSL